MSGNKKRMISLKIQLGALAAHHSLIETCRTGRKATLACWDSETKDTTIQSFKVMHALLTAYQRLSTIESLVRSTPPRLHKK